MFNLCFFSYIVSAFGFRWFDVCHFYPKLFLFYCLTYVKLHVKWLHILYIYICQYVSLYETKRIAGTFNFVWTFYWRHNDYTFSTHLSLVALIIVNINLGYFDNSEQFSFSNVNISKQQYGKVQFTGIWNWLQRDHIFWKSLRALQNFNHMTN